MIDFKCYFCNSHMDGEMLISSKDIRFQCYGEDKNIWKCNKCGLIQLFPQWKENELGKNIY